VPTELDQPRLLWMQLQPELCEPLAEIGVEPLRFIEVLETHDETEHQARAMARALRAAIASRLETLGLEQYKIYVEMADRISARRGMTNTFFLTLNTAIFTAVGVFWQHPPTGSPVLLTVPCVVLLIRVRLLWSEAGAVCDLGFCA
jgi:hypothetical protein